MGEFDSEKLDNSVFQREEYADSSDSQSKTHLINRFKSSFARKDVVYEVDIDLMNEYERTNYILAHQPLKRSLTSRHLQMIAIGGTIGSGLLVGISYSLANGPGAALIGFMLVGIAIYCVVQAAAELSVAYPVSGSFAAHVSRFISPAVGFTVATNYALSWIISFPSELIAAAMTVQYWSDVNPSVWIAVFLVSIMIFNLFGVRGYGELEFSMSIIKLLAVFIFLVIGIVIICGGTPGSEGYLGAKYWHNPGAFAHPVFKSICSTFVSAAFSYGGTELVVLTAAESSNLNSIARASKQVFWRIAFFYITTIVIIGCLVPYTDHKLIGEGTADSQIATSPFVIALGNSGTFGSKVSHFMNAIVLLCIISVANSCVYASSRVIQSLGASGQLPEICGYIDQEGRPLIGIVISCIFGLLGFLVSSSNEGVVFTWFFSLCSISSFFTWGSICISHIRFRMALSAQDHKTDELSFRAQFGVYGSILGALLVGLLIIGEIYISIWPLGSSSSAKVFFQNCLSIPLMMVIWLSYTLARSHDIRKPYISLKDIDLVSGRVCEDIEVLEHQNRIERERISKKPIYYRLYYFWC